MLLRQSSWHRAFAMSFFLTGFLLPGYGQAYIAKIQRMGIHQGLSDAVITAILKTGDNEVWVGTEDGLNRFDGFRFQEYNELNSNLNSNEIHALVEGEDGDLIVLTQIKETVPGIFGLYVLKKDSEEFLSFEKVYGLAPFKLSQTKKIFRYLHSLILITLQGEVWEWKFEDHTWNKLFFPDQFTPFHFYEGNLISDILNDLKAVNLSDLTKLIMIPDAAVVLKTIRSNISLSVGQNISNILEDSKWNRNRSIHWIAIDNKVIGIDSSGEAIRFFSGWRYITFSRDVRYLYVDDHDLLYVGTEDGLNLVSIQPVFFSHYGATDKDSVFAEVRNYSCRGIGVINPFIYINQPQGVYRYRINSNEPPKIISSIIRMFPMHVMDDQHLIFGRMGLFRYNILTEELDTLFPERYFKRNPLWSVYVTENKYYLGCKLGAFILDRSMLDSKRLDGCKVDSIIQAYTIYYMTSLADDRIAFCTSGGLFINNEDDSQHPNHIQFQYKNGRKAIFSQCSYLLDSPDSTMWITTLDGGVVQFILKDTIAIILHQMSRDEQMPTNTTYAILADKSGMKWISTDVGLIQLRPNWTFRLYTMEDGLPDNEFNRLSYYQDKEGNIYFGGLNGVIAFDPEKFYETKTTENSLNILYYAQYSGWRDSLFDRTAEIKQTHQINFSADDTYFEIQVGLSDIFRTSDHKYEFRFKDLATDWETMRGNMLRINALPYGPHNLEIRGQNAAGFMGSNILAIAVSMHRPFYLKWWFFALVGLGIVLILREYMQGRARQIDKLEYLVKERTQVIEQQSLALRQAEAARSLFFANISHELRTPLTLIKGPVMSLLQGSVKDESAPEYLRMIRQNAETLTERIDDLLLLSRSDADHLRISTEPFQINNMLELLLDNFKRGAKEKGIKLQLVNTIGASQVIEADRKKLEHILSNFLSNAIKFMVKQGTIVLKASVENEHILLSVKDEGPGIDRDDLSKVFERFYQVGNQSHQSAGTGIGLSLSKELAEIMGGSVWAESIPEKGSIFYLQIPFTPSVNRVTEEKNQIVDIEETAEISERTGLQHSRKLLIVEDHRAMREFLFHELSEYQVVNCSNGREAIDMLTSMKNNSSLPDLIISDVMMPVMDGFEMLKEIKSNTVLGKIPVIMLTARVGLEDKLEALRIGVDDYIAKPFDTRELKVRIHNLLVRRTVIHADPVTNQIDSIDQQWLRSVEQEILKHVSDSHFTISQLAESLHTSERQFHRRIKNYTGLTANHYIREVRLYEAKRLLESRVVATVAELAYKVGFEGPDYFSRLYMERFGKRPSAFL